MKLVFGVVTFIAAAVVVGSAPTLSEGQVPGNYIIPDQRQMDYYRDTRSQYPQYVSPCAAAAAAAAAASAPIAAIAPPTYQLNIAPYHGYPSPQQYSYGMPHYRSVEMDPREYMSFSDMDHMMSEHIPMARYCYAAPAHSAYAPAASSATTAPVFGVFPNANAGGCNVPLLFSCTPSVVPGHVVQAQPQYNYAAAASATDAYRGVEPLAHHDSSESHEEPTVHEHLSQTQPSHAMVHQ